MGDYATNYLLLKQFREGAFTTDSGKLFQASTILLLKLFARSFSLDLRLGNANVAVFSDEVKSLLLSILSMLCKIL